MRLKENTYPVNVPLPGLPCDGDPIGHLDFEDIKPEPRRILMEAIGNRKAFDTGWHGTDKGFAYMRIQSNGRMMRLSVSQAMDDWPEIVADCPGGETLTEDEIDRLGILADAMGFVTSTSASIEIGWEPFERVLARLNSLCKAVDAMLEKNFDTLKHLVNDVLDSRQEDA